MKKINFSSVLKPKLGGGAGIRLHLRLLEIKAYYGFYFCPVRPNTS